MMKRHIHHYWPAVMSGIIQSGIMALLAWVTSLPLSVRFVLSLPFSVTLGIWLIQWNWRRGLRQKAIATMKKYPGEALFDFEYEGKHYQGMVTREGHYDELL